jgi:ribose-phosphate pyrophosphokinase
MIKLMNFSGTEIEFKTTKFPDGTSQIWKLEEYLNKSLQSYYILWQFENEAEVFQVCQLADLIYNTCKFFPIVYAPYLPYGRQDKVISNESTFAKLTMQKVLKASGVPSIYTFDAHSSENEIMPIVSIPPTNFLKSVYNHDMVVYPDKGAQVRYQHLLDVPSMAAAKKRNQLTGEIEGICLLSKRDLTDKKILIIDDICDGGGTFIGLMEELKKYNPAQVDLAVSHGIFSKRTDPLHNAGIKNIYTTNSLFKNDQGFNVLKELK